MSVHLRAPLVLDVVDSPAMATRFSRMLAKEVPVAAVPVLRSPVATEKPICGLVTVKPSGPPLRVRLVNVARSRSPGPIKWTIGLGSAVTPSTET